MKRTYLKENFKKSPLSNGESDTGGQSPPARIPIGEEKRKLLNPKPIGGNVDTQNEWSTKQWESYLTEIEADQTEAILSQAGIVEQMPEDYYQEGFSELIGTNYSEKLTNMVSLLMQALTDRQQAVIKLLSWESYTMNEAAVHLGISKSGIKAIRNRALARISQILLKHRAEAEKKLSEAA